MDFSAFNPLSSNSLSLAARINDVAKVKRLLKKQNPDLTDNRGWTCLHEAAANDSYESLELIIKHPNIRVTDETFEGHTALYLACIKRASIRTIKLLLETVDEIANIVSIEMVSPLHIASGQGRIDVIQMLLDYGAYVDVQDFDGDTPLHDAAFKSRSEVVNLLLHAGAQPEKRNEKGYTPLHLACFAGCIEAVIELFPFVTDVDLQAGNGETALMLATQRGSQTIVEYLIQNKADPHITNVDGDLPLNIALVHGHSDIFRILLSLTNKEKIKKDMIIVACKPYYFNMDIITTLLESDLGPDFFNIEEILYVKFEKIDGIMASVATGAHTLHELLPYTLACEPMQILKFLHDLNLLDRISVDVSVVGVDI
ncbi:Ankyrin repeat and SOCS box protein 3 [Eumeta japonica]|uniref:Ankyrin repeat and SOCS box protein 3 n=1 Tax=Eumeta variegata TaxID=151549 RepID=A0A4C1WCV7_EUMVA|nr:Ankyrin repeat and SOCS box protein 3 [Eumeta japonica]